MFIWCGSTSTFRPLAHIASFVYVALFAQRAILLSFAARRLVSPCSLYRYKRESTHITFLILTESLNATRIARPRVCIPPSTHPASSKQTLYLVCVFYPFLFSFFVIIVVAIDETNAKLLKQRVSDSGLDLPSQKKTRRAVCLVPLRIIPLNWHAFHLYFSHLISPFAHFIGPRPDYHYATLLQAS